MIALALVSPPLVVIILIVVLIVLAIGPRTYYRSYSGPPSDWLWILIAILIILWLFGVL